MKMLKSLKMSLLLVAIISLTSCSKFIKSDLVFEETEAVQRESGDTKIIGFARNDSKAFITMAVLAVSYILDDGSIYVPQSRFVIDVYAAPGEKFPIHTGWEKVPHFRNIQKVTLYSIDPVRNPKDWDQQSVIRKSVRVENVVPYKAGAYLGFRGDVFMALEQPVAVHVVFACYDSNNKLHDVDGFTLKPSKDMPPRRNGFSFGTASSATDKSPKPEKVVAYVQWLETASTGSPDGLAPEPSIQ
jgi:hypothetical protein